MPVKYWSFAGLMLTDWCDAKCASCYLGCSPAGRREMTVEAALGYWRSLQEASPHGCRIHLSGGEPFGDWPRLIELARRARSEGLGPLEKVETNAGWAVETAAVRDRLRELDAAGLGKLVISCDPFHQQFVPIDRCRLAARLAEEVLGPGRVQVRWRDWLAAGFDTFSLDEASRRELFAEAARSGRDRLNGRAAEVLAPLLDGRPPDAFAGDACRDALLRSKHVHVLPDATLMAGTCAGLRLGDLAGGSAGALWRTLYEDHARRPVLSVLASGGPHALYRRARAAGYPPRTGGYATKCHLCRHVRDWMVAQADPALDPLGELGPSWL